MMNQQQQIFWETIGILNSKSLLKHFIVIGSWAEYLYEIAYFKGFSSNLRTMDLDFYIKNLRTINPKINLPQVLESYGFIYDEDSVRGTSKFYKEGVIELEFLVKELGSGQSEPYKVESLGIKAEGLRHLELLSDNSMLVNFKEYSVCVPLPQAYILHKLIINSKRGVKREKDIRAIRNILDYILLNSDEINKLKTIYSGLSLKEKKKVDLVCEEYNIILSSS